MPQRPKLARQESFARKMLGTSGRSRISFGRKGGRKKISNTVAEDAMNIFCCSDLVSRDFILDKLHHVKQNPKITKLEMEDLIIAEEDKSLLPLVQALLLGDDRPWQRVHFIDSFPHSEFTSWQSMKRELLRDYKESLEAANKPQDCVTFLANVELGKVSATKHSIISLFNRLLEDQDVQGISFGGALFATCTERVPAVLSEMFDDDCALKESVVVTVKCGLTNGENSSRVWGDLLASCLQKLDGRVSQPGCDQNRVDNLAHQRVRRSRSVGLCTDFGRSRGAARPCSPCPPMPRRPQVQSSTTARQANSVGFATRRNTHGTSPPPLTEDIPPLQQLIFEGLSPRPRRKLSPVPRPPRTKLQRARSMDRDCRVNDEEGNELNSKGGRLAQEAQMDGLSRVELRSKSANNNSALRSVTRKSAARVAPEAKACSPTPRLRRCKSTGRGEDAAGSQGGNVGGICREEPERRRVKRSVSEKLPLCTSKSLLPEYDWSKRRELRYDWAKGAYLRMEVPSAA